MSKISRALLAATLMSIGALATTPITTHAATNGASTVQTTTDPLTTVKEPNIVIIKSAQAKVYSNPQLSQATGRTLPFASSWAATAVAKNTETGTVTAYQVATNQWIAANDITTQADFVGVQQPATGVIYISSATSKTYANPDLTGQANGSLPFKSGWKYTAVFKNGYGRIISYQVSTHQWVPAGNVQTDSHLVMSLEPGRGILRITKKGGASTYSATGQVNGHLAYGSRWRYAWILTDATRKVVAYQVGGNQFVTPEDSIESK